MLGKLQGLRIGSWGASLVGGFFVNRPWSHSPKYSYCSLFSLYALLFNVIAAVAWADYIALIHSVLSDRSFSERFFASSLMISGLTICWSYKLLFFSRAKAINRFLIQVTQSEKIVSSGVCRTWVCYKIILVSQTVVIFCILATLPVFHDLVENGRVVVSTYPYNIVILFLFVNWPNLVMHQFSFSYIMTSTFYLLFSVESFFNDLKVQVELRKALALSVVPGLRRVKKGESGKTDGLLCSPDESQGFCVLNVEERIGNSSGTLLSKEEILSKFRGIKYLCNSFSYAVGPFFLVSIVSSVVILIHSVDAILSKDFYARDDRITHFKLVFGLIHIFYEASRLTAIFVGSLFHRRVDELKEELFDGIYLMEDSPFKVEIENLAQLVKSWKWKVTGWGIFVVDRPVIAGVLSSVMSYVVILFQINLSDRQEDGSTSIHNSTKTTTFLTGW